MYEWPEEIKTKTISLLQLEYNKKKESSRQTNANINFQPDFQSRTFAARVFGFSQS